MGSCELREADGDVRPLQAGRGATPVRAPAALAEAAGKLRPVQQGKACPPQSVKRWVCAFLRGTGADTALLWGVSWWVWMRPREKPRPEAAESGMWDRAGAEGGGGQRTSGPSNCWPVWAASGSAGMGLPALLQASGPATAGSRPWVEPRTVVSSDQRSPLGSSQKREFPQRSKGSWKPQCSLLRPWGPAIPGRAAGREGLSGPILTPGQASGRRGAIVGAVGMSSRRLTRRPRACPSLEEKRTHSKTKMGCLCLSPHAAEDLQTASGSRGGGG